MKASKASYDVLLQKSAFGLPSRKSTHLYLVSKHSPTYRALQTSPVNQQKRKSRHKNLTKDELDRIVAKGSKGYKSYTDAEKSALGHQYSAAQLAAIEAGEAAINPQDLAKQATFRRDFFVPQYLDDFSRIEPVIDKKIEKLRGDGSDYETAFEEIYHIPVEGDDFADSASIESGKTAVGRWIEVLDDKGEPTGEQRFERSEEDIENMTKEAFMRTREYKSFMDGELDNSEVLKDLKIPSLMYKKHVPIDETDLDTGKVTEAQLASALQNVDIHAIDKKADIRVENMKKNPKYIEIRDQMANSPIPSRYGFGTTVYERRADDLLESAGLYPDVAPDIPKIEDPTVRWASSSVVEEGTPEAGNLYDEDLIAYARAAKAMGQTVKQLRQYRIKTLFRHRVVNQTRLGKIQSMYFLVVAGNGDGMVGIGEGKAAEQEAALRMAQLDALKNMVPILRYENRTIYGDVEAKVGASVAQLSARRPGFGVRTNQHIFEIARCAGIQDLAARTPRSRNPMNIAKAVWEALKAQRDPDELATGRGKKLVDARKVYYNGFL